MPMTITSQLVLFFYQHPMLQPLIRRYKTPSIQPALDFISAVLSGRRDLCVAEIGARYGESSAALIRLLSVAEYHIIDPYTAYTGYSNDGFFRSLNRSGDRIMKSTQRYLNKLNSSVTFHRKMSNDPELLQTFGDLKFDLVFIDGNHQYEFVIEDLSNYWSRIAQGGVLVGDDYHLVGVRRAVQDFVDAQNLKIETFGQHSGHPKLFVIKNRL